MQLLARKGYLIEEQGMTYLADIFTKAASLGKPVVINMSQGDNLGPHDGTSLLERGIDNLLGGQGRAMVKSAGNAGADNIHASGMVTRSGPFVLQMVMPSSNTTPDTVDLWYPGADRFAMTIAPPGGTASQSVAAGSSATLTFANGNQAFVDSTLNDPFNQDNRIFIQFVRGSASAIQAGTWTLNLTATTLTNGRFHAWIERGQVIPRFIGPALTNDVTISIPGTSREIIAVASYVTKGSGVGSLSLFSSRGPTRDGHAKPEIAAPGQAIMSARAGGSGTNQYHVLSGTSMSTPHVTGAIALMLQKDHSLTQDDIKQYLTAIARTDAFTGTTPNNA
jgi:subtilisin family serine protease